MAEIQGKWRYVWETEMTACEPMLRDAALMKHDISRMMLKGCNVKKLKSEMRKLGTLNAAML